MNERAVRDECARRIEELDATARAVRDAGRMVDAV
jgi:hypothetical protein